MKLRLLFLSQLIILTSILFTYQNCAPVQDSDLTELSSHQTDNSSAGTSPLTPEPELPKPEEPKPEEPKPEEPEPEEPKPKEPKPNQPPVTSYESSKSSVCAIHISNTGNNINDGTYKKPVKDVHYAINKINKSGAVCFLTGNYNQIKLQRIKAPKDNPLILRAHSSALDKVFIIGSDVSRGIGVSIYSSENVIVRDFSFKNLQKGVAYYSVTGGGIYDNKIERVGLEGIHVGAHLNYSTRKFENGPSSYIEVIGNYINGTGYHMIGGKRHDYGEGIYIGTGAKPGDLTHNILVKANKVKDTSAEAIEVKPHTQYVDIIENTVENINLQYSAAITISVSSGSAQNTHARVIGNKIKNVTTRKYTVAGIVVGNGTTEIIGNTISDVEGGRAIRVLKAFHNANARKVTIKNNTVYGGRLAINDGDSGYPGMTGIVETSGNIIKP